MTWSHYSTLVIVFFFFGKDILPRYRGPRFTISHDILRLQTSHNLKRYRLWAQESTFGDFCVLTVFPFHRCHFRTIFGLCCHCRNRTEEPLYLFIYFSVGPPLFNRIWLNWIIEFPVFGNYWDIQPLPLLRGQRLWFLETVAKFGRVSQGSFKATNVRKTFAYSLGSCSCCKEILL